MLEPLRSAAKGLQKVLKAFSESARQAALEARRAKAKGKESEAKPASGSTSTSAGASGGPKVEERAKVSQNGAYKLTEADKTEAQGQLDAVASSENMKVFETKITNYGTEMTSYANHPDLGRVEIRADTGAGAYNRAEGGKGGSWDAFRAGLEGSTKSGPVQFTAEITGGKDNSEYMQGNIAKVRAHGATAEEAFAAAAKRVTAMKEKGKFHPFTWYAGRGSSPSGFDAGFSG